eukprot:gene8329-biopygen19630
MQTARFGACRVSHAFSTLFCAMPVAPLVEKCVTSATDGIHHTQLGAKRRHPPVGMPPPPLRSGAPVLRANASALGRRVGLQFALPRVHAPGAQMIQMASGSSLTFQRLSR